MDPLGLYVSIPFCRAKCTFCNFASDAFAPGRLPLYVDQLCAEIASAHTRASSLNAHLPAQAETQAGTQAKTQVESPVDTLYFGGGTPSLLAPADIRRIFTVLRQQFLFAAAPEITVECAPGQLSPAALDELQRQGVNRLSFGVQSFVDRESAAIGRLHTARQCLEEIERVRSSGVPNLSLDLIAGLPHQTEASWRHSLEQAVSIGVPHISVYMLEVDNGSRLGRELLSEGARYGASTAPTDDQTAAFYEIACDLLNSSGVAQYEISNFARPGFRSLHNLKYWQRQPYLGFGLDAHSMLRTPAGDIRFSNTDDLDTYLSDTRLPPPAPSLSREAKSREANSKEANRREATSRQANSLKLLTPARSPTPAIDRLTPEEIFEETLFLGLRLNDGIDLDNLRAAFGFEAVDHLIPTLNEAASDGLLDVHQRTIRLTALGRVLSNELFSRLLLPAAAT